MWRHVDELNGRRRVPRGGDVTYINPLANALPQSLSTQKQLSVDKTREARHSRFQLPSVVAGEADQFEHHVESSEEAAPIHEEARQKRQSRGRGQPRPKEELPKDGDERGHINLTA
jgi:hypothetical protein